MESQGSGKKPRNYYVDYSKKNRRGGPPAGGGSNNARFRDTPDIGFGNKGFLITSVDEVKSYLEMRNIFEKYFEDIYKVPDEKSPDGNNRTTEDELESELRQLRMTRPFKQVKTHCRNSVFINIVKDFAHVDPVVMVDKFFDDLLDKREITTSNTFKVLPVIDTFRNSTTCAKDAISSALANFHETEPKKFFIEFTSRGNYRLNSDDKQKMIEGVAERVTEVRPNWSVDRENADYIISLVALRNVCCLSILKDYFKRCKYNVTELCKGFVVDPAEQPRDDVGDTLEE